MVKNHLIVTPKHTQSSESQNSAGNPRGRGLCWPLLAACPTAAKTAKMRFCPCSKLSHLNLVVEKQHSPSFRSWNDWLDYLFAVSTSSAIDTGLRPLCCDRYAEHHTTIIEMGAAAGP